MEHYGRILSYRIKHDRLRELGRDFANDVDAFSFQLFEMRQLIFIHWIGCLLLISLILEELCLLGSSLLVKIARSARSAASRDLGCLFLPGQNIVERRGQAGGCRIDCRACTAFIGRQAVGRTQLGHLGCNVIWAQVASPLS